jgi:hypothetical protein
MGSISKRSFSRASNQLIASSKIVDNQREKKELIGEMML